jgi:hypothetical protein
MLRVANKAVFLSDSNRFGQGRYTTRILKLGLYKCNLWHIARFIQTKGKMYTISEGDGLGYSYRVFDSHSQLANWADTIWAIQTGKQRSVRSWLEPLLTASSVLLCAIKRGRPPEVATPSAGGAKANRAEHLGAAFESPAKAITAIFLTGSPVCRELFASIKKPHSPSPLSFAILKMRDAPTNAEAKTRAV